MKNTVLNLINQEQKLANCVELQRSCALPEKSFFLQKDVILCYPRKTGDARYPYSVDGFTLWAYSSGYMSLNESTFYYILPADEGKEPYVNFFGGLKEDNGYTPVSLTGVARQPRENAKRFTVYTPQAVYYVTRTEKVDFCLRAFVSQHKKACFSVCAINKTQEPQEIYLSAFLNCLLMHQAGENVETKWFKKCSTTDEGFLFESVEDLDRTTHLENFGVIRRDVNANVIYSEHTTSRADYVGGKTNCQNCATPLFEGHFEGKKQVCNFTDTAAAGDIYAIKLDADGYTQIDYVCEALFDKNQALAVKGSVKGYADQQILADTQRDQAKQSSNDMLQMTFGNCSVDKINGDVLTKFVHNVQRQVEFAALAKNSGVSLLGVRDVAQQLESALMWNPTACRAKILEVMNFVDPSGRAPRQYSLPAKGALPQMDTRQFIDQGVWLVDLLYSYLAFSNDYSILEEVCGYYKIVGRNQVEATDIKDTVFDHLTRIMDYLIVNIDNQTGCLRALYGDWNDALDGLGVSIDPTKEYGSGVSVMASLQLYKDLDEMLEILSVVGDKHQQAQRYTTTKEILRKGLTTFAIESDDKGNRKILHGWGDQRSYKVGSFADVDGLSRDGLATNAFWVISNAYLWDKSIKRDILNAYKRLDSKYGLKTFEPYFAKGTKGVGRIINLPKGTAENAATYIHATLFGIWSLFGMGEGKLAWEQLAKVLPLTHDLISTTPFIMSNSYSYNVELGMDGESMSDWFTGSANVLLKALVWNVFGVLPNLKGVTICPSAYMPFDKASISLKVKGKVIEINYSKNGNDKRTFAIDGKQVATTVDEARQTEKIYIDTDNLTDMVVDIVD